jgi:hypothetical protein
MLSMVPVVAASLRTRLHVNGCVEGSCEGEI